VKRKSRDDTGDLPDWVACDAALKSLCQEQSGPQQALARAWKQADRIDVFVKNRKAPLSLSPRVLGAILSADRFDQASTSSTPASKWQTAIWAQDFPWCRWQARRASEGLCTASAVHLLQCGANRIDRYWSIGDSATVLTQPFEDAYPLDLKH
jgi:hypothetical protein